MDYALPKRECKAPTFCAEVTALRMRYSHFRCNVVHEDIAFRGGVDSLAAKMPLKHEVERMGRKLPAGHGHGTEYVAPEPMQRRWMQMDPLNVFNPRGRRAFGKAAVRTDMTWRLELFRFIGSGS